MAAHQVSVTLEPDRRVVVVGAINAAAELAAAEVTDVLKLDAARVIASVFDEASATWSLHAATGELVRAHVVIAAREALLSPWVPELAGRDQFRGVSFAAARWDAGFDPAGKRIALVGADSVAGHHIGRLAGAASVTVFAHAPRRTVPELPIPSTRARRWLYRRLRPGATHRESGPVLVGSAIDTLTAFGVRTRDGVDHPADAVVYGTGFTPADPGAGATVGVGGVTLRHGWTDGTEPYFGVAMHGFPNYFVLGGSSAEETGAQARYVAECVRLLADSGATRIEVRRSSQQVFNERVYVRAVQPQPVSRAFDLSNGSPREGRESYDGAATLMLAGTPHPVRVRLGGRLDPIDGRYHWQGTVFGSPSEPLPDHALSRAQTAILTVGDRSAPARITEQTPWGTHSIVGVGAPPYPLGGN